MARQEIALNVFISSPNDVVEDRDSETWNANQVVEFNNSIGGYGGVLGELIQVIYGFRSTVQGLPRATVEFNKSRNRTVHLLDKFIETLTTAEKLVHETKRVISEFVK